MVDDQELRAARLEKPDRSIVGDTEIPGAMHRLRQIRLGQLGNTALVAHRGHLGGV